MNDSERFEAFGKELGVLAGVFARDVSAQMLEGYWRALRDLAPDALVRAIAKALRTCRFMPTPAELRELSVEELPVHVPPPRMLKAGK